MFAALETLLPTAFSAADGLNGSPLLSQRKATILLSRVTGPLGTGAISSCGEYH